MTPPDVEITATYKMRTTDWQPLIDAMKHLSNLPQCGDVAKQLHDIFVAAQSGKYYVIELMHENQEGKCFVVSEEFGIESMLKKEEKE